MNLPRYIVSRVLLGIVLQLILVVVVAAVPGGAPVLARFGLVIPWYESGLFTWRWVALPFTDPEVALGAQQLVMFTMISMLVVGAIAFVRAHPWELGVPEDSETVRHANMESAQPPQMQPPMMQPNQMMMPPMGQMPYGQQMGPQSMGQIQPQHQMPNLPPGYQAGPDSGM